MMFAHTKQAAWRKTVLFTFEVNFGCGFCSDQIQPVLLILHRACACINYEFKDIGAEKASKSP